MTETTPLTLQIAASEDMVWVTLTNVSDKPLKVLRGLRWGHETSLNEPIILEIRDSKGRLFGFEPAEYEVRPKAKDWTRLRPGQTMKGGVPIKTLGEDYVLRKERYSIRAIYHWPYYTRDGKKHDIRVISNTVSFVSKTDIKADFCAGHSPDGRHVPRRLIIEQCSGRPLSPFEVEAICAASGGCPDK